MGLVLTFLMPLLWQVIGNPTENKLSAIVLTVLGIGIGGALYAATALLLRSEEIGDAVRLVLKRKT
jgi:hypothetical protein